MATERSDRPRSSRTALIRPPSSVSWLAWVLVMPVTPPPLGRRGRLVRQRTIAGANVLDAGGAFKHDAGDLQTGNERQLGPDLVFPLHHQDVGKVDAGSAHADAHLSGPEGRARNLRDLEAANPVQRAAQKCAHDHAPAASSGVLHAAVASAAIALSSRRISLPVDVSGNVSQARTLSGTL